MQGLLELLDVAYVGSGVMASAVCMDKVVFKELMAQGGLPQVGYALRRGGRTRRPIVGYPVGQARTARARRWGSERGRARGRCPAALESRIPARPAGDRRGHCTGIEVEASVLGTPTRGRLEPGEIVLLKGAGWYDFEAKYSEGGMRLRGAGADFRRRRRARPRALAAQAFTAAGCSGPGAGRLLRRRRRGGAQRGQHAARVHDRRRSTARCGSASGLGYPELVDRLCRMALERADAERGFTVSA